MSLKEIVQEISNNTAKQARSHQQASVTIIASEDGYSIRTDVHGHELGAITKALNDVIRSLDLTTMDHKLVSIKSRAEDKNLELTGEGKNEI